jgi:transmembrane sensor
MRIFAFRKRSRLSGIYAAAASHVLREQSGQSGVEDQRRVAEWLRTSPECLNAYEAAKQVCAVVSKNTAHPEIMAMRSAALLSRPRQPVLRDFSIAAGLVAAAVGLGVLMLAQSPNAARPPAHIAAARTAAGNETTAGSNNAIYRTQTGERSSVALSDGSAIVLDTDSAVEVAYNNVERGVRLLRGQALFEVAKHKPLPFRVHAGSRIITAVGTRFDVRLFGSPDTPTVRVSLLEGAVNVTNADRASLETASMVAGEVLQAPPSAPMRVRRGDAETLASWEGGVLVFNDRPLGEAVEEMNRYTMHPIVLADESSRDLRVSGVFNTSDPEHFAETIAETFALRLNRDQDGAVRLITSHK